MVDDNLSVDRAFHSNNEILVAGIKRAYVLSMARNYWFVPSYASWHWQQWFSLSLSLSFYTWLPFKCHIHMLFSHPFAYHCIVSAALMWNVSQPILTTFSQNLALRRKIWFCTLCWLFMMMTGSKGGEERDEEWKGKRVRVNHRIADVNFVKANASASTLNYVSSVSVCV